MAAIAATPAILATLLGWLVPPERITYANLEATPLFFTFAGVIVILLILIQVLASIAMVRAISDAAPKQYRTYFAEAWPLVLAFIWINILSAAATLVGFLLFIIPGIIVSVYLSVTNFALILGKARGVEALTESFNLVKGRWWQVFWRTLVLIAIGVAASLAVGVLAAALGYLGGVFGGFIMSIAHILLQALLAPFTVGYAYFLYQSLQKTAPRSTQS